MKRRALKLRRWLAVVAGLGLVLTGILVAFDFQLLCVTSPLPTAEAIVVLGGEPVVRAEQRPEFQCFRISAFQLLPSDVTPCAPCLVRHPQSQSFSFQLFSF